MAAVRKKPRLKPVQWDKRRGVCNYCEMAGVALTREHLLPRCFGGKHVIIRVCRKCNRARSNSAVYPPFLRFIAAHPDVWKRAKRDAEPMDAKKYARFLQDVSTASVM